MSSKALLQTALDHQKKKAESLEAKVKELKEEKKIFILAGIEYESETQILQSKLDKAVETEKAKLLEGFDILTKAYLKNFDKLHATEAKLSTLGAENKKLREQNETLLECCCDNWTGEPLSKSLTAKCGGCCNRQYLKELEGVKSD